MIETFFTKLIENPSSGLAVILLLFVVYAFMTERIVSGIAYRRALNDTVEFRDMLFKALEITDRSQQARGGAAHQDRQP